MALDPSSPRSRRALLSAAVAATAVTVVEAVARPLPVSAVAPPFLLGVENTTTAVTTLTNSTSGLTALAVNAVGGIAVEGQARIGVLGRDITADGNGVGVLGDSVVGSAVRGNSETGNGVRGFSVGGVGVKASSETGNGVQSFSNTGTGVSGFSASGIGVHAETTAGTALDVIGKASFSRSGRAAVTAGHKSVTVSVEGGLAGTPLSFANLSSYRPGVAVAAVRPNFPSAGKMRIYLTKVMTSSTSVSWMVMD